MKYVREHINEKFKEAGDPIHDMGIGQLSQLAKRFVGEYDFQNCTMNQLLIIGAITGTKDDDAHYDLIKFALDNGADLMWKDDKNQNIVKIHKVYRNLYKRSDPKINYVELWSKRYNNPGKVKSSLLSAFRYRYSPVTTRTLKEINYEIRSLENFKSLLHGFDIKIEEPPR